VTGADSLADAGAEKDAVLAALSVGVTTGVADALAPPEAEPVADAERAPDAVAAAEREMPVSGCDTVAETELDVLTAAVADGVPDSVPAATEPVGVAVDVGEREPGKDAETVDVDDAVEDTEGDVEAVDDSDCVSVPSTVVVVVAVDVTVTVAGTETESVEATVPLLEKAVLVPRLEAVTDGVLVPEIEYVPVAVAHVEYVCDDEVDQEPVAVIVTVPDAVADGVVVTDEEEETDVVEELVHVFIEDSVAYAGVAEPELLTEFDCDDDTVTVMTPTADAVVVPDTDMDTLADDDLDCVSVTVTDVDPVEDGDEEVDGVVDDVDEDVDVEVALEDRDGVALVVLVVLTVEEEDVVRVTFGELDTVTEYETVAVGEDEEEGDGVLLTVAIDAVCESDAVTVF
jgi:hypothetical protein